MPRSCRCTPISGCCGGVLQNLISNALRYTRSGRWCGVRRRAGDQVEFQVIDTGPGIAAESQSVISRRVSPARSALALGERGLGLGLSICDRIAHILQTQLTLRSVPGRGSAFSVRWRCGKGVVREPVTTSPASVAERGRTARLAGSLCGG